MANALPFYAELHCCSNFSFLRGASHSEELVERAQALGDSALASDGVEAATAERLLAAPPSRAPMTGQSPANSPGARRLPLWRKLP
jgi:error-prone DNA polymerase